MGISTPLSVPARVAKQLSDGRYDLGPGHVSGPVWMEGELHFVTLTEDGPRVLSASCPHLGSEIEDRGDCFECPHHGWRFDRTTGQCVTTPSQRMVAVPVVVEDGRLIASRRKREAVVVSSEGKIQDLSITLHAHACLEFRHRGYSLLTDPWLVGPAFMGAWTHYPPTMTDVEALRPDAIWISHEHSDHFHEPTLLKFPRETPVFVPDFPNRRMVNRLKDLGFKQVVAMPFGETLEVSAGVKITCFEPGSLWNDAVVLIEFEDGEGGRFRFLNLNDAGLNRRIAGLPQLAGGVDVIASSFTPGASGYPLTWTHLGDGQKDEILTRARAGILRMLKEAATLYGGKAILPFAGHFALVHPTHAPYVAALKKNTVDDVVEAFRGEPASVIDLMPGESFDVGSGEYERKWKRREKLYEPGHLQSYLKRTFSQAEFEHHHPAAATPSADDVATYFLSFNQTSEIAFCEELTFLLRLTDETLSPVAEDVHFRVQGGRIEKCEPVNANLTIEIPGGIFAEIARENLSWDEAHIGYWCRFSRNPDVFHANFWRMLQAPYFGKPAELTRRGMPQDITAQTPIATILERKGEAADRILRRQGLYCTGCQHSTSDTLAHGAKAHGLSEDQVTRMLVELNATDSVAQTKPLAA